jgi:hypothetical protein
MFGLQRYKIEVIRDLAARFPAGIEAWIALRALPVSRQKAKTFTRIGGRYFPARSDPVFEYFLAGLQQVFCCRLYIRRWQR